MVESRDPGRTGEYGWSEKAGLSQFKSERGGEGTKVDGVSPAEGEASGVKATRREEKSDGEARDAQAKKSDEGDGGKKKKRKRKKQPE